MKFSLVAIFALSIQSAVAHPGMKNLIADLKKRVAQAGSVDGDAPAELLGDLATTGPTTPTGQAIADILTGAVSGQSSAGGYLPPGLLGTAACKKDTCCVWSYVSLTLTAAFLGPTGRCNSNARAAIRLGFHDAGAWKRGLSYGGADGSIALSGELSRSDNKGLEAIVAKMITWQKQYASYGVGMADLIQFGAVHAAVICPLGPRVRFFAGRKDSSQLPPEGLLPGVSQSADALIALFNDKTIPPHQLAALVGAHSTSEQFFVNTSQAGAPQDSTPGVWDVRFYNETLAKTAQPKVFRFQSDLVLSVDPRVNDEWVAFAASQSHWNEDYSNAYTRLSLLGVNNINNLTECSKVLPPARTSFLGSSIPLLDQ